VKEGTSREGPTEEEGCSVEEKEHSLSCDQRGDCFSFKQVHGAIWVEHEAYQQSLKIRQTLADQDKTNSGWQRDLIVSLYKVATIMAKIGGDDDGFRAKIIVQQALNLTDKYPGDDRQQLIDALNQALQQLVH
jgi:hypothetical protein